MKLGEIRVKEFLDRTRGIVRGRLISDAKIRAYQADYTYTQDKTGLLHVTRRGSRTSVTLRPIIDLDEALVSFFGFYSGDGAKGSESGNNFGMVSPTLSVSQSEPNLIRFTVEQFRKIFPGSIYFTFSLGEDSAYFMAGQGFQDLQNYYGGEIPSTPSLADVRPRLDAADRRYLLEKRPVKGNNENFLAFYFHHKEAMEAILREKKRQDIERTGIELGPFDKVTASLRRPFKKGAREPGGSSRADETHVGGVTGFGELFLKMLHELESSIQADSQISTQGLIVWNNKPLEVGAVIDVKHFFTSHPYGAIGRYRPKITERTRLLGPGSPSSLVGIWPRSKEVELKPTVRINPLWCYASGLYLAEGTTNKADMIAMYKRAPSGFGIGFTSSENTSLELLLCALQMLFQPEDCLRAWKVKVGSQYFPELVVIGLKNGVPMLRGGSSGDGKLRTMEISIAIKNWALSVAPCLTSYKDKYSHVEPTGAGVARIDFWASSVLCKWFFPLVLYATFGRSIPDPRTGFC
jgi:hypothetical protein